MAKKVLFITNSSKNYISYMLQRCGDTSNYVVGNIKDEERVYRCTLVINLFPSKTLKFEFY